jgi:hypothetical protein
MAANFGSYVPTMPSSVPEILDPLIVAWTEPEKE